MKISAWAIITIGFMFVGISILLLNSKLNTLNKNHQFLKETLEIQLETQQQLLQSHMESDSHIVFVEVRRDDNNGVVK